MNGATATVAGREGMFGLYCVEPNDGSEDPRKGANWDCPCSDCSIGGCAWPC